MISDDERREVAARLRNELQYMKKRSWWYEGAMVEEGGNAAFRNIAGAVKPGSNFNDEYIETVERLADLIDRPTCRNVHDGREFECSECGMQWHLLDRADALEEWAHVRSPRYCPNCGAEVIPHAERRD